MHLLYIFMYTCKSMYVLHVCVVLVVQQCIDQLVANLLVVS